MQNNKSNQILNKIDGLEAQDVTNSINATVIAPALNLGLAGLKFSIPKSHILHASSEITNHFLANGTPVQQHIANNPITITLTGEIHELTILDLANSKTGILQNVTEKLTTIAALAPAISSTYSNARKAIAAGTVGNATNADIASNSVNASTNLYSLYKNMLSLSTNQGKTAQFILALRDGKVGLGIDTSRFGYFTDMYIDDFRFIGRDNTEQISDIEVILKKLRFTSTQLVPFDKTAYQGRLAMQAQDTQNVGKGNSAATTENKQSLLREGWEKYKR